MSGVPEETVHLLFLKEWAAIEKEHGSKLEENLTSAYRVTPEMVRDLYLRVTTKLGVADEPLTGAAQSRTAFQANPINGSEKKSIFESRSSLRVFNVVFARKFQLGS
jgi:hypothetical protein